MFYGLNKSLKEERILKLIYTSNLFPNIKKREEPDFEIGLPNSDIIFGVEITELYNSESSARMKNIPNYFFDILDNNSYRHKDDKNILKVHELTLIEEGKPDRIIDGIVHEQLNLNEFVETLANTILIKEAKAKHYDDKLDHLNLIVYDTELRFINVKKNLFSALILTNSIKDILKISLFREIFFITHVENNKMNVAFPLQLMYFITELLLLCRFINEFKVDDSAYSSDSEVFADYLYSNKFKNVYFGVSEGHKVVIMGNYGFLLGQDDSIDIRDYKERPFETNIIPFTPCKHTIFTPNMIDEINEYSKEIVFKTNIGYEVDNIEVIL